MAQKTTKKVTKVTKKTPKKKVKTAKVAKPTKVAKLSKAIDFSLKDQEGKTHTLSDYKGSKVILYFYPKDMTSGCTLEAQGFQELYGEFSLLGVEVFGISPDDVSSHKEFCEKEKLTFPLLADVDKKVAKDYGVWVEKSMYGKKYMGVRRDSFVIDEEGTIIRHFENVKPVEHPQEMLDFIKSLR